MNQVIAVSQIIEVNQVIAVIQVIVVNQVIAVNPVIAVNMKKAMAWSGFLSQVWEGLGSRAWARGPGLEGLGPAYLKRFDKVYFGRVCFYGTHGSTVAGCEVRGQRRCYEIQGH